MSKTILNYSESSVRQHIEPMCTAYGMQLHPKMRLADTFDLARDSMTHRDFNYYLSAHFDLVVSYGNHSILGIEFDGPSHDGREAARRDWLKDHLAHQAGFPVLRVRPIDIEPDPTPLLGRLHLRLQGFVEAKSRLLALGCPQCQEPLREIASVKGVFFGCSRYHSTGCRGSRQVADVVRLAFPVR